MKAREKSLVVVQTDLHSELPSVSACHGGALPGCEDSNCPNVHGRLAELTSQEHSLKHACSSDLCLKTTNELIVVLSKIFHDLQQKVQR